MIQAKSLRQASDLAQASAYEIELIKKLYSITIILYYKDNHTRGLPAS